MVAGSNHDQLLYNTAHWLLCLILLTRVYIAWGNTVLNRVFQSFDWARGKDETCSPILRCFNSSLANQCNSNNFGTVKQSNSQVLGSSCNCDKGKCKHDKEKEGKDERTSSETVVLAVTKTGIVVTVIYWSLGLSFALLALWLDR